MLSEGSAGGADDRELDRARAICQRQLASRPRTRAELAEALRRRGIADEVATQVLDRYDEVGLVDDAAFAKAWVTSRHAGRGLASGLLARELRRKGVAPETIGSALAELDPADELATARALAERKLRPADLDRPAAALRRLIGVLLRKGYPQGVASQVAREVLADQLATAGRSADPDAEEFGCPGDYDPSIT